MNYSWKLRTIWKESGIFSSVSRCILFTLHGSGLLVNYHLVRYVKIFVLYELNENKNKPCVSDVGQKEVS